jgi:hypothetical protein
MIMMKKALFEEVIIHVDKEEMARLLDLEEGFAVQQIEEDGTAFRLIFSRKTDISEQIPRREERSGRRHPGGQRNGRVTVAQRNVDGIDQEARGGQSCQGIFSTH